MKLSQAAVQGFSFGCRDILDIYILEGLCHAEPDAFWLSLARVAFLGDVPLLIHLDVPEGTDLNTHLTPQASALVYDHRLGLRVSSDHTDRTDLGTQGFLTLNTGKSRHEPFLGIEVDRDVRLFASETPVLIKGTRPLAVPASHAAFKINPDDLHLRAPQPRRNPNHFILTGSR